MYKKLSGTHTRDSAPGPLWGLRPRPPFRLALRALAMVRPPPLPWQILDPPTGLLNLFSFLGNLKQSYNSNHGHKQLNNIIILSIHV